MDVGEQRLDESQLRNLSTVDLVRHLMSETKLLVRAEVLHAKAELKEEAARARTAGILIGAGVVLVPVGLAVLFTSIVFALPIAQWLSALVLGVLLLAGAGLLAFLGLKRVPKKPLPRTMDRLKLDWMMTREELQ